MRFSLWFDYWGLFDGKYGGEDDKGFRYGLEVQPICNLRDWQTAIYDDGGETTLAAKPPYIIRRLWRR